MTEPIIIPISKRKIKMLKITLPFIFIFSCASITHADTILKIKNEDSSVTEIMSNGEKTRFSMAPEPGYVLISHTDHDMFIIVPEEKSIMKMNMGMPTGNKPELVNIQIKSIGSGPKVAGYQTKKYTIKADGQDCGIVFGSKKALQNSDISKMFNDINQMMENQYQMMGGAMDMMDACERAEMNIAAQIETIGLPLRTLDKNGVLTSDVLSIETHATLPATTYELPSNYAMTSMAEEMKSMQEKMPDMEKMMESMNKSGHMPPDAIEELKRIEEMMKQFQQ